MSFNCKYFDFLKNVATVYYSFKAVYSLVLCLWHFYWCVSGLVEERKTQEIHSPRQPFAAASVPFAAASVPLATEIPAKKGALKKKA